MTKEFIDVHEILGGYFNNLSILRNFTILDFAGRNNSSVVNQILVPRHFVRNSILSDDLQIQIRLDNKKCKFDDFNEALQTFKNYKLPIYKNTQIDFYFQNLTVDGNDENNNTIYTLRFKVCLCEM